MQDKRDLVNSIVARAHLHEEQSAFGDALNDWEILRTIYSQYPGLKFEIERIQKRRDQQSRIETRTQLIEQIDSCLHSSDYARVFELLQGAMEEFPNDEELQELEKHAKQGIERKTEAQRLMAEGQDLCAQQKPADGIRLLRQAYELDENNSLARAVLANTLIEQAQTFVESDWREAEKLAKEAFDLNPGHPMAKTLRTLILDQKRETFVGECVSQARKLQTSGDLASAMSRVEEALSSYPREMRLMQIRDAVQRDLQTQRRQTRRRDLEELHRLESEADSATDADTKQTLGSKARALADKYLEDEEVVSSANGLLQKLNLPGITGKGISQDLISGATLSFAGEPTIDVAPEAPSEPPAPQPPPPPLHPPPTVLQEPVSSAFAETSNPATPASSSSKVTPVLARRPPKSAPNLKVLAAAGSIALVFLVGLWLFLRQRNQVAQPVPQAVNVQPPPVVPSPQPDLPVIRLASDAATGKVTFDDQPPVESTRRTVDAGQNSFRRSHAEVRQSRRQIRRQPYRLAGVLPVIKTPIAAKGILAVIVSSMGDHVHVYASGTASALSLDGQPSVEVPAEGADLSSVAAGAHELVLSQGGEQYKLAIEVMAAPALSAFVESGQNVGTLVVVTGQDKSRVSLNGKALPQETRGGQLRIANLEPKEYVVRVVKPGFQDAPDQKIRIRKGEQGRLVFGLLPVPHMASLNIQGAPAGATVLVRPDSRGNRTARWLSHPLGGCPWRPRD